MLWRDKKIGPNNEVYVDGNSHTVDVDTCNVADLLDLGAGKLKRTQVPEDQVVVRATRLELVPVFVLAREHPNEIHCDAPILEESRRERLRVLDDLLRIRLERRLRHLKERHRNPRNREPASAPVPAPIEVSTQRGELV